MNGFSKYDKAGNVIYSESKSDGEIVRHFYSYNKNGQRIMYRKEKHDKIFQEHTYYHDNGNKTVITYIIPEHLQCERLYNRNGRIINEVTINANGNIIHRIYNNISCTYDIVKTKSPFIYII